MIFKAPEASLQSGEKLTLSNPKQKAIIKLSVSAVDKVGSFRIASAVERMLSTVRGVFSISSMAWTRLGRDGDI